MIPISLPDTPRDERFLGIVYENIRMLLLCMFEEAFRDFEDEYDEGREEILTDKGATEDFAEWIDDKVFIYPDVPRIEVVEQVITLYCVIRSYGAFDIEKNILMSDILYRLIVRAQFFRDEFPKMKSDDPAVVSISAGYDLVTCVVGRRISPEADRDYALSTYKKYRREHKETTMPVKDFKKVIETVKWLDIVMDVGPHDKITEELIREERRYFLPKRWWDPSDDIARYNDVLPPYNPEDLQQNGK